MKRIVLPRAGYQTEMVIDKGVAHSRRLQTNRSAILDQNRELRKTDAIKRTDGLRLALDIPLSDMPVLNRFFPGIADPAHPDYRWQMRRFMNHPASAPYRVSDGSKTNAGHIVVK